MKKHKKISVTKASGDIVPFAGEKLLASLKRSGASPDLAQSVLHEISSELYEGIPTKKIYSMAFKRLKKRSRRTAGKYRLKQAIMELGPSGFPFEKFIAQLLERQGYSTIIRQVVKGHCVNHEIDVIAEKGDHHFMVECKYHNLQGISCDVKIPLYIYARFKDVEKAWLELPGHAERFHQPWVVTNTKFTSDAIQYGTCMNMQLVGWNYPQAGNIRELIDNFGLYPLTCLTSLAKHEKQALLEKDIVLCREVTEDVLVGSGILPARAKNIMLEIYNLTEQPVANEAD